MERLVIIHDNLSLLPFYGLFRELGRQGVKLEYRGADSEAGRLIEELGGRALAPLTGQRPYQPTAWRLLLLVPAFCSALLRLYLAAGRGGRPAAAYFGHNAQAVLPPAAALLGIRLAVFRSPDSEPYPRAENKMIRLASRWARYWVLTEPEKGLLAGRLAPAAALSVLPLAIGRYSGRQADIFSQLANARREHSRRKFYSVGAIAPASGGSLDALLYAAKDCLSAVKELQLIIIASSQKSKQRAQWLAKKLGMDSLVWLMGPEALKRKWCENLDLYLVPPGAFSADSLYGLLAAQAGRVPVVAPDSPYYRAIVENGRSGILTDPEGRDSLSLAVISLYRNRPAGKRLAGRAEALLAERHSPEAAAAGFRRLFAGA